MGKALGIAPLVALAVACSSSKSTPSLTGTSWVYESSGGTGIGLDLADDGGYELSQISVTSSTSGNVEVEKGTYSIDGNSISFTPKEWSCEEKTDAPYTATFAQSGDSLDVGFSWGAVLFQVDASSGAEFADTLGCFLTDGAFVAEPLEPIGSCAAPGESCASPTLCCDGNVCIQDAGSTYCAGSCSTGSDCQSGCCHILSGGTSLIPSGFCEACVDGGQ